MGSRGCGLFNSSISLLTLNNPVCWNYESFSCSSVLQWLNSNERTTRFIEVLCLISNGIQCVTTYSIVAPINREGIVVTHYEIELTQSDFPWWHLFYGFSSLKTNCLFRSKRLAIEWKATDWVGALRHVTRFCLNGIIKFCTNEVTN